MRLRFADMRSKFRRDSARVDPTRPRLYEAADGTISTLFLLDYGARLLTATEHSRYRRLGR